ncbi:hypothetical protein PAXINDRAFT_171770 [Paxillus involutus ATCC 200175]|uniref:Uncharacterized protein n=1 Tax=Paxillus involutus ATCC 200175 TaxID=664439 RepID=A0A0C9SSV0_PAXIN|nr:hypothetical protein PAXINDRAFT_171770 [Paxillus involutus ATCC 200175]
MRYFRGFLERAILQHRLRLTRKPVSRILVLLVCSSTTVEAVSGQSPTGTNVFPFKFAFSTKSLLGLYGVAIKDPLQPRGLSDLVITNLSHTSHIDDQTGSSPDMCHSCQRMRGSVVLVHDGRVTVGSDSTFC